MDPTHSQALRELLDRQAIWQVLQRLARGLDRLDVELVRSCYFDDAVDDHGHYVGDPDGFIAWANQTARRFRWTHHALTTHNCELAGDDAYCETYFLYVGVREKAPHFLSCGRYVDHFQRRRGEWRIANRVIFVEGTFDLPESALAAALPPAYGPGEAIPASRDREDFSYHRPPRPRQPRRRDLS